MIENKMTEVLIRICYYCKRKFVKEDGCNKMTCSCGKQMCYICRQPVDSNYTHFYHQTVMENKCPLYTDENIVHATAVEAAARLIINELKMKKPELLRNIDINKILPALKKSNNFPANQESALDINKVVATVIGQNVEDINNLKEMRSLEPQVKKPKY
uniref:E3 ubiquitin-protein ligase RNF216 n=2 Tax=Melanaphis sacchari TaxID=742174 RepID=A0A2H8TSE3_9HEMI